MVDPLVFFGIWGLKKLYDGYSIKEEVKNKQKAICDEADKIINLEMKKLEEKHNDYCRLILDIQEKISSGYGRWIEGLSAEEKSFIEKELSLPQSLDSTLENYKKEISGVQSFLNEEVGKTAVKGAILVKAGMVATSGLALGAVALPVALLLSGYYLSYQGNKAIDNIEQYREDIFKKMEADKHRIQKNIEEIERKKATLLNMYDKFNRYLQSLPQKIKKEKGIFAWFNNNKKYISLIQDTYECFNSIRELLPTLEEVVSTVEEVTRNNF